MKQSLLEIGWVGLPWRRRPRWWLPRGPARVASAGPWIYQPVTLAGRIGWESARVLARMGGFRLLPRIEPPPQVQELLRPYLPPHATYALMRAVHEGRFVALLLDRRGIRSVIAKMATTLVGREALLREAEALSRFTAFLPPGLEAPVLIASNDGILLLEAKVFKPRAHPWAMPVEVASGLGRFFKATGAAHGDVAPWNLLQTSNGWVLVDWEAARQEAIPFFDLFHFLVQAHSLLGRPTLKTLMSGMQNGGWVADSIAAYAEGAAISARDAPRFFGHYLNQTVHSIDLSQPDGLAAIRARKRLIVALQKREP